MSHDGQTGADDAVEEDLLWERLDKEYRNHLVSIRDLHQQLLRERQVQAPPTACGNAVDEVLDELHTLRLAIDAYFEHDLMRYVAFLDELGQHLLREGWVLAPPPAKQDESAA
jgi:hypothetical protein